MKFYKKEEILYLFLCFFLLSFGVAFLVLFPTAYQALVKFGDLRFIEKATLIAVRPLEAVLGVITCVKGLDKLVFIQLAIAIGIGLRKPVTRTLTGELPPG